MASEQDPSRTLKIDVSPGEILDKISILEIKSERIDDAEKLKNVRHELGLYHVIINGQLPTTDEMDALVRELKAVNETLWNVEDEIRACEARQDFGPRFIELARSVYRTNDRRASIKKQINTLCGSPIVEEKSYTQY